MPFLEKYEKDIIQWLIEETVSFVIVGGLAMKAHGIERERRDLDLLVLDTEQNKKKLLDAIGHRWPLKANKEAEFLKPLGMWRQAADPPFRGFDFAAELAGLDTRTAIKEAIWIEVDGLNMPILSVPSLIKNKMSLGTDAQQKDLDDLAALKSFVAK
ncbi:hypothetical protein EN873_30295 [bacterium M00.F.Ca.ET.230.01.1.1]|nr:hypothetical protein EN873_30295 [bacterium M00.F.Ca.ET.230.01.1.1]